MSLKFRVLKVNTLPAQADWAASTMYYVPNATDATLMDLYFTNSDGTSMRHIVKTSEIQTMIDMSLANFNQAIIVANIAERNALVLTRNTPVWVIDATADTSVVSGAALYLYKSSDHTYTKISEAESMDVVVAWNTITGRPTSSVADIDDAVARKHSHANKLLLDKVGEDLDGDLIYNNKPVGNWMDTVEW